MTSSVDLRPSKVDLYIYTGDSLAVVIGLVDGSGQPFDSDGWSVEAEAVSRDGEVVEFTTSLVGANLTLRIGPDDTIDMAGLWRWYVTLRDSLDEVRTVLSGGLSVTESARG